MELDIDQAMRYLGAGTGAPEELRTQVKDVAYRLTKSIRPRFTFRVFPLEREAGAITPAGSGVVLTGNMARKMLAECDQAALLLCTLGPEFDAQLRREQARDMAGAVILDACGSAWVEAGCDQAEQEIAGRFPGKFLTDRFSPGYGDLPLTVQGALCAALDARRRAGVWVTNSLLLNPAKSVTAVVGLAGRPQMARIRGCAYCNLRESCTLRKGGKTCEP